MGLKGWVLSKHEIKTPTLYITKAHININLGTSFYYSSRDFWKILHIKVLGLGFYLYFTTKENQKYIDMQGDDE